MRARSLLAAVALAALSACGGPSDEEEVRRTLSAFQKATNAKDYQALCDDILAKALVDEVRSTGVPCELALKTGLEDVEQPRVLVRRIRVRDDRAFAEIRSSAEGEEPSNEIIRLVREEDDWRIASLAARGPEPEGPETPVPED